MYRQFYRLSPCLLAFLAACSAGESLTNTPTRLPISPMTGEATTWTKTFEGPDYGAFFDVSLSSDGHFIAVGATNHLHVPPYSGDVLIMKLTLMGEVMWEKSWGGDGFEQAMGVEYGGDEGIYVFGETDSYGAGDRDFFLLKLNESGDEEWSRTYGRQRREWPFGMLHLTNEDLFLFGFTESTGGTGRDQYALRVSPGGEVIWEYQSKEEGEDLVLDALETANGDLVLAVSSQEDPQLVRLDANGQVLWSQRFELPGWQYPSQIATTNRGDFILAGFSMSEGAPRQADTWFALCNVDGELVWETSFGDPTFDDYATSLIRLNDDTYLIGAIANGVILTRVDGEGEILWRRSLLDDQVYGSMALLELNQGGYLIAGLMQLVNGRSYDALLMRTDPEGRIGD